MAPFMRLLRGRVVIREIPETHPLLALPSGNPRERKTHRGTVLAMGPPSLNKWGHEVPWGFDVGDEVVFHFEHNQEACTREWVDGMLAYWMPQYSVDGVIYGD